MKPLIHFVWRRDTRSSAVAERHAMLRVNRVI